MRKLFKFIINHPIFASGILLSAALILLMGLVLFNPKQIKADHKSLPIYGWFICGDLGVGEIPNHAPAQRFKLCNRDGTLLLAFCFDPTRPPPPVGTYCDRINTDTFWCGDIYQPIKIYELIPTRTPFPTATATRTPTLTRTPTATRTPTHTATSTQTHTATPPDIERSTETPTPTATTTTTPMDKVTLTPTRERDATETVTPTPTKRARMGGESNFQSQEMTRALVGVVIILFGMVLAFASWKHVQKG